MTMESNAGSPALGEVHRCGHCECCCCLNHPSRDTAVKPSSVLAKRPENCPFEMDVALPYRILSVGCSEEGWQGHCRLRNSKACDLPRYPTSGYRLPFVVARWNLEWRPILLSFSGTVVVVAVVAAAGDVGADADADTAVAASAAAVPADEPCYMWKHAYIPATTIVYSKEMISTEEVTILATACSSRQKSFHKCTTVYFKSPIQIILSTRVRMIV